MFGADGGAEALHDEYLAATLKKAAGLPDHVKVAEMRLEYGVRDESGSVWGYASRAKAEEACATSEAVVVREAILTEWREATPRGT